MGARHANGSHEAGDIVGKELRRVSTGRFVGFSRPTQNNRDTGKILGVVGHLEGITGIVRRQVGNEDERFSCSFLLIMHSQVVYTYTRHLVSSSRVQALESREHLVVVARTIEATPVWHKWSQPSHCPTVAEAVPHLTV